MYQWVQAILFHNNIMKTIEMAVYLQTMSEPTLTLFIFDVNSKFST